MSELISQTLDLRHTKCPMTLIKSSKAINGSPVGDVLKIITTKRGSISLQGLAFTAKNVELIKLKTIQNNGTNLYAHHVRRTR